MVQEKGDLEPNQDITSSEILKISIPQPLTEAFQVASRVANGQFYLMGSLVRNCILNESEFLNDIDFIGAFDLDHIQDYFGEHVIRRWDQFQTIKVLHDNHEIDFIGDINIKKALEKRDITLSLMCIDKDGIVYDPLCYIDDLRNRLIRIENAEEKIKAEPERILRVLRFAATLGYEVEPITRKVCTTYAGLMNLGNTEYALNKFLNMNTKARERAIAIAEEFGIIDLINNLISEEIKDQSNDLQTS